jgi:hypothetical protein
MKKLIASAIFCLTLPVVHAYSDVIAPDVSPDTYNHSQYQSIEAFRQSIKEFPEKLIKQGCKIKVDFTNSSHYFIRGIGSSDFCKAVNSKVAHLTYIFMATPKEHFCDFSFTYGAEQLKMLSKNFETVSDLDSIIELDKK